MSKKPSSGTKRTKDEKSDAGTTTDHDPSSAPIEIAISAIEENRFNPRLGLNKEEVEALTTLLKLAGKMQPRHAVTVVRLGRNRFRLINGHHRYAGAKNAGLTHVLAFVVDLDDREQLLAIGGDNLQSSFGSLEYGRLGLWIKETGKHGDLKAFATANALNQTALSRWTLGATVWRAVESCVDASLASEVRDKGEHFALIAASPQEQWKEWVQRTVTENLTVVQLRDLLPSRGGSNNKRGASSSGGARSSTTDQDQRPPAEATAAEASNDTSEANGAQSSGVTTAPTTAAPEPEDKIEDARISVQEDAPENANGNGGGKQPPTPASATATRQEPSPETTPDRLSTTDASEAAAKVEYRYPDKPSWLSWVVEAGQPVGVCVDGAPTSLLARDDMPAVNAEPVEDFDALLKSL